MMKTKSTACLSDAEQLVVRTDAITQISFVWRPICHLYSIPYPKEQTARELSMSFAVFVSFPTIRIIYIPLERSKQNK